MPIDLRSAATTLTKTVNSTLSNVGLVSSTNNVLPSLSNLSSSISSGISSSISGITGSIPGIPSLQSAFQNAQQYLAKDIDIFKAASEATMQIPSGLDSGTRIPNPLSYYSSFNYVFTLSVLDDFSLNFPNDSYKKGMLGPLILKSGSGNPNDRIATDYKTSSNPEGKFDFFIDNLRIDGSIGFDESTGNTNTTGISFTLIEPYSMGLFFQSLQIAAKNAGYLNYLDLPVLLTIEFTGHVDYGNQNRKIDNTTKHIPMKLLKFGMKVSGKGCTYDITGYPWNEGAFSSTYSELKTDISIAGKTVGEMLQTGEKSLQAKIADNKKEGERRNDVAVSDQIIITFPKEIATAGTAESDSGNSATMAPNSTASAVSAGGDFFSKLGLSASSINQTQVQQETDLNVIGASPMGFTLYNKADMPFAKEGNIYNPATGTYIRSEIKIDPNLGEFKFAQGSDIINAINQVILMSEYGKNALKQISSEGKVKWWRVEPHMYNMPTNENIPITGTKPRLVVYRVIPYNVDSSKFLPPNAPRPGTQNAKDNVVKEYDYIYTGKNTEIIDFNIEFNAGFYTALNADAGANNGDSEIVEQLSGADEGGEDTKNKTAQGRTPVEGQVPTRALRDSSGTKTRHLGGGGLDDAASLAARQFHDAITQGVDMINLSLTILGDPYYLGDGGLGNYSAVATDNENINADSSMDWQRGIIFILINFRTPIDINHETGLYDFYNTASVPQFSGLYQVLRVTSSFARGKFTQTLELARVLGQEVDDGGAQPELLSSAEEVPYDAQPDITDGFDTSGSEAIMDETGQVSNIRRNTETGELYDATGLYNNQGRAI